MSVGVMRDQRLKLRDVHVSHTVELYTSSDTGLGRKRKIRWFCFENFHLGFFGVFHPRSVVVFITPNSLFFFQTCTESCWVYPMLSVTASCASAFSLGREGLTSDRLELH